MRLEPHCDIWHELPANTRPVAVELSSWKSSESSSNSIWIVLEVPLAECLRYLQYIMLVNSSCVTMSSSLIARYWNVFQAHRLLVQWLYDINKHIEVPTRLRIINKISCRPANAATWSSHQTRREEICLNLNIIHFFRCKPQSSKFSRVYFTLQSLA